MGPRSALALTTATAALLLAPAPATAAAQPLAPRCGDPGSGRFPVATALGGGDGAALRAGGARHNLTLRLRNASDRPCRGVHPVAVFSREDGGRLRPGAIRLKFYDAEARRWRSVAFERTGADESAGVFAAGFRGFALPAGGSREVPVRLGFAADASAGRVTVNVTTVQRRGDDGEWIGQSEDYEVGIEPGRSCCGGTAPPGRPESSELPAPPRTTTPREESTPERPRRRPAEPGTPPTPPGTGEPGRPEAPDAPTGPWGPEASAAPDAPTTPEAPNAPAMPDAPTAPAAPGPPDAPAAPSAPAGPAPPGAPGGPAAPEGTGAPGGLATPGGPAAPGTPGAPAAPGDGAVPRWPDDVPQPPPLLPDAAPMPEGLADTGPRLPAAATAGAAASLLLGTALLLAARRLRRDRPAPRTPPAPPPR
jgi:hypothetical protein